MSRQDRVLLVLGLVGALGLVIYPLAYRISSEQTRAKAAQSRSPARPSASTVPTPAPTLATSPTDPTPFTPTTPPIDAWAVEATGHRGANGESFDYECSPDGTFGPIWGTDTYTDNSSVCTAGVHMGFITRERGGSVRIIIRPALASYLGTTRNGVTTDPLGSGTAAMRSLSPEFGHTSGRRPSDCAGWSGL